MPYAQRWMGVSEPLIFIALLFSLISFFHLAEAQYSVKLVGAGGAATSNLYNAYGTYYGYSKDNVALSYSTTTTLDDALSAYKQNLVDFVGADTSLDAGQFNGVAGLVQLPIAGLPLVIGYNLPTLLATDTLVLTGDVLARIWLGQVTHWNDSAIVALNPNITARLPNDPIYTAFGNGSAVSTTTVFKRALNVFTGGAFARNGSLVGLAPVANGFSFGFTTDAQRIGYVSGQANSLTYMSVFEATNASIRYASMRNAAGVVVTPTQTAVQAAMTAFRSSIDADNLTVDILNANSSTAWPLSYISFALIPQNLTTPDCSNLKEFLQFLAWTQLNSKAGTVASSLGYTSLINAYRRRLIDAMGTIYCNGDKAFTTAVLLGMGPSYTISYSWVADYPSTAFKVQYTAGVSQTAITEMSAGDIDYAAISTDLTAAQQASMPDAAGAPMIAYGILPVYNISELLGHDPIIMDWQAVADIFLNKITMWNDSYLAQLNPHLAGLLPEKPITIVYQTDHSPVNSIMTEALSKTVPEWREQVYNGSIDMLPHFPAMDSGRAVGKSLVGNALLSALTNLPYSFGFYQNLDVVVSRTLKAVSLYNAAGNVVQCNTTTVASTLNDRQDNIAPIITLTGGEQSWPLVLVNHIYIHTREMTDCVKAGGLLDYLYWTQTDSTAATMASNAGVVVAATVPSVKRTLLNLLANTTCGAGVAASSLYGCIIDGTLCSDHGVCTSGKCECDSGWQGDRCSEEKSSSADVTLAVALGVAVPLVSLVFLLLLCALIGLFIYARHGRRGKDDWEIDASELDMGVHLGTGGFGAVHRAMWKGTEVAVKMMNSANVTREMERSFKEEVRVMTALRHPNVVLFMAASTKPPKMFIVMEFMGLGSLYDLLQNELVPELPYLLKVKMAYQAAKGMHFLHSSGIVHRDLKSLNLLLDHKWNLKVSDFGLTKFKEDIKTHAKGGQPMVVSVHWTAPEVLNESPDADLVLADVYSFGIILWELLTRQQPYAGLSPAAVAVAVIRDNLRPTIPEEHGAPPEYVTLMRDCWNVDPVIRPAFLEVMTRLSTEMGAQGSSFKTGSSSTSSMNMSRGSSWTASASGGTSSSGDRTNSSAVSANRDSMNAGGAGVRPPEGDVAIVFSDITRAASLWESCPAAMRDATLLHNETLRGLLRRHCGYEAAFPLRDRNSGEGSFCMAFQDASSALDWCVDVQRALLEADWPADLLRHPGAAEELVETSGGAGGDKGGRKVLFRGLRVRMGVHWGRPRAARDPMTRRAEYTGPAVNAAAAVTALAHGGQILLSQTLFQQLNPAAAAAVDGADKDDARSIRCLGRFELPDALAGSAKLYELKAPGLEARFFGGVEDEQSESTQSSSSKFFNGRESVASRSDGDDGDTDQLQTAVGEGMTFAEDKFLTSANLCRWVLDFNEIQVGAQVGLGSFGVVYRGRWKGVDVAVKRFIKQRLDERRLLEFRAEMAFLSELHHPNIVLFIGACVTRPNLCIVTEFVKRGSLDDVLQLAQPAHGGGAASSSAAGHNKLGYEQKLRLLRSAALGINYLHSLKPVIVHRDLKPSNLLVDENWNVKVADFGFARIKEENTTMTRCGTPCWTAPEIIRGERYDERADVFAFGIIMWQVLTRKQPFAGRNFMGVSLDVLEGRRPAVPSDCPQAYRKMMKRCWADEPQRRPAMEDVVAFFDAALGEHDGSSGHHAADVEAAV